MGINGIVLLTALILMVALIGWVIWAIPRDRKKGISYITTSATTNRSSSQIQKAPLKKLSRPICFGIGAAAIFIGIGSYWLWNTTYNSNSLYDPVTRIESVAMGLVLMGVWFLYRAVKDR